jgi:hypothetical protein
MPVALAGPFTTAEVITIALIVTLAGIVSVMTYRAWKFSRITPEERERRRRLGLVTEGKMGDATVLEIREDFLFYSYAVRGVEYTASQDLALLRSYLPTDMSVLVGAVSVKYDARNPANSIVLAEDWSGLRAQPRVTGPRK